MQAMILTSKKPDLLLLQEYLPNHSQRSHSWNAGLDVKISELLLPERENCADHCSKCLKNVGRARVDNTAELPETVERFWYKLSR